jgi:apolipoprotein N-acyltransferase
MPRLRLRTAPPRSQFAGATPRTKAARRYVVVLLSGATLSLAYPGVNAAALAWVALVPLLVAAARAPARRGLGLGLIFGTTFFGLLLMWISYVGWVAWALLVLLEAAFLGLFGLSWALVSRLESRTIRVLLAATLWVAVEYLRSISPLGGFTWGELAQSQHNLSWILGAASLGGGWTIAFLLMLVNALVAEAWHARSRGSRRTVALLGAAAVALVAAPLVVPASPALGEPVRIAIVQGNVPRDFEGSGYAKELAIMNSHLRLTEGLASSHPDLVIWPESSVGLDAVANPDAARIITTAARSIGVPLIIGGNLDVGGTHYKVMAFEVDPTGKIVDAYQKTHLVPFGEYVPARGLLGFIPMLDQVPRDAIPSNLPTVFDVAGGKVAPVISYEGDFGSLVRERIERGGRLLVVATNTSTWGFSSASAQHLALSQVRAAENGVWVAHAALSGISAFIAPDGGVVSSTPLWKATTLMRDVRFARRTTFYTRTGDWLPWGSIALSIAGLVSSSSAPLRARFVGKQPS